MQTICILGRQPALGLAELESHFGSDNLSKVAPFIAMVESEQPANFDTFGSLLKSAKLLKRLDNTDWKRVTSYLQKTLPEHLQYIPEGKITLGISTYGFDAKAPQINAAALSLKKVIKKAGRSARVVPNNETDLNTAQVLHNKLTSPNGMELLLIKSGNTTLLAQTYWVQDIEAYSKRDQVRPMRDSKVGMLPPKLAQIIINLATDKNVRNTDKFTVLDPFCGTGVLLQEASLMGYNIYGSDLDQRMVDYSRKNLEWLRDADLLRKSPRGTAQVPLRIASNEGIPEPIIEIADATNHTWNHQFDTIAAETYLGRPFAAEPDMETLQKVMHDTNIIHKKFLENLAQQTKSGFRMCIAVPAWHIKKQVYHLPLLDHLEKLGYNRLSFVHARDDELVYRRADQVVGRELVVLTRK